MSWSCRGVALLLTLSCSATVFAFNEERGIEHVTQYRIHSQNLFIDELTEKLDELEAAFDKLSPDTNPIETNQVRVRLKKLEGNPHCTKNELTCGDCPECVNHLLVCDGVKDCHNGMDESDRYCSEDIIRVGSTFQGITHWTSCSTEQHDQPTLITITASDRLPFFKVRSLVWASITNDKSTTYAAVGCYLFGLRRLTLIPIGDNAPNNFSIVCSFQTDDINHADCRIVQAGTDSLCAKLKLSRV
jgi:hypothetical protein